MNSLDEIEYNLNRFKSGDLMDWDEVINLFDQILGYLRTIEAKDADPNKTATTTVQSID